MGLRKDEEITMYIHDRILKERHKGMDVSYLSK